MDRSDLDDRLRITVEIVLLFIVTVVFAVGQINIFVWAILAMSLIFMILLDIRVIRKRRR